MSFGLRFRVYLDFPGRVALVLGVLLAALGILDIVLAVVGFVQKIWGNYYATGIWCGVVVFIDGLSGILAGQTRTTLAVKMFFVLSVTSCVVSFIMIILSCGGIDFKSNFYDHVFSYTSRNGQPTRAVHGSLLALGIVEFMVSVVNAILCLKSTCYEDKSAWAKDEPKLKPLSAHRPPSGKSSDVSQGFIGGNPSSVPRNEMPTNRRYHSPRRQQNGVESQRNRRLSDDPNETTEFLPNQTDILHLMDEDKLDRERRRRSRGSNTSRDATSHSDRANRGRRYHRQTEMGLDVPNSYREPERTSDSVKHDLPKGKNTEKPGAYNQLRRSSERTDMHFNEHREQRVPPYYYGTNMHEQDIPKPYQPRRAVQPEVAQSRHSDYPHPQRQEHSRQVDRIGQNRGSRQSEEPLTSRECSPDKTRRRSQSVERTDSYRQKQTSIETEPTRPPTRQRDIPNEEQSRLHLPTYRSEIGRDVSGRLEPEPLRRSVGSRGSYSAAINLMPTESPEHMSQDLQKSERQNGTLTKPPTAFGEEELPAYEKVNVTNRIHSHIYSSVESALSGPGAVSADTSHVSQSVVDEEVQEILGTGRPSRLPGSSNVECMPEIPFVDEAPNNVTFPNRSESNRVNAENMASPPKRPFRDRAVPFPKQRLNIQQQNNAPTTSQSASNESFVLPSPLPPSPAFVREDHSRTSDILSVSEPESIPDIKFQKAFRASVPQRKVGLGRPHKTWGIADTTSSEASALLTKPDGEGHALSELSSSFPLLGAVGGVDFGMSDQDSYLQTPDSSIYSFKFDEVKPRVFDVSPYRTPRKSSPLTGFSVPQLPSSEDELENRTRVIETVNVGIASPSYHRRDQPKPANKRIEKTSFNDNNLRPDKSRQSEGKSNVYTSHEPAPIIQPSDPRPRFFYPPERLPSKVTDEGQTVKQPAVAESSRNIHSDQRLGDNQIQVQKHAAASNLLPQTFGAVSNAPTHTYQEVSKAPTQTSTAVSKTTTQTHVAASKTTTQTHGAVSKAPTRTYGAVSKAPKQTHGAVSKAPTYGAVSEIPMQSYSKAPAQTYSPQALPHRTTGSGFGGARAEDANVAFLAFQDTLLRRDAWERQTFPPILDAQLSEINRNQRGRRTVGRAARRAVMRSEQSAQEEPLHAQSNIDPVTGRPVYPVGASAEPSAPLCGGPPPYSAVARTVSPRRTESGNRHHVPVTSSQNSSGSSRRQPVFSLVL